MEKHHQKTSSTEMFSFPSTPSPDQDFDFEFGCFTPDSPTTDPYKNSSPADHLFFNGRLLPHSFPVLQYQQPPTTSMLLLTDHNIITYRSTSRTSSLSSKDSLSSRSSSTNSSRSSISISSARRSSSGENSERRRLCHSKTPIASKVVMARLYGSSQRWQHILPAPVLKLEDSRRKHGGGLVKEGLMSNKKQSDEKGIKKENKLGSFRRFFRSFLVACRECHAMEPSTKDDVLHPVTGSGIPVKKEIKALKLREKGARVQWSAQKYN